jgi:hypothetical protein
MKKIIAAVLFGLLVCNISFGGEISDEIKDLHKLYQEGILTEEEFIQAKSKIIGTEKQSQKNQETKKEQTKSKVIVTEKQSQKKQETKKEKSKKEQTKSKVIVIEKKSQKKQETKKTKANLLAEIIKFPAGIYEGGIDKKGRANGEGVFKFSDGSVYEGTFSKNRFHKKGKLLDHQGNVVFEGKHRYGRFTSYPDTGDFRSAKNKKSVILKLKTGITYELKKKMDARWYEAKEVNGEYQLTDEGKLLYEKDKQSGSSTSAGAAGDCGQSWGIGVDGNPL